MRLLSTLLVIFISWSSSASAQTSCTASSSTFQKMGRFLASVTGKTEKKGTAIVTDFNGVNIQSRTESLPDLTPQNGATGLVIDIDPTERHQPVWGFGANATESCVTNVNRLSDERRDEFMQRVFDPTAGAGFSYLRLPLGGNDYTLSDFSLDDTPNNQPDPELRKFNFDRMKSQVAFVLAAKRINPDLQLMISPWSAPAWMKDTGKLRGGILLKKYFDAYARYLVKALEEYKKYGVDIDQLTVLNEPLILGSRRSWGCPQMYMSVEDQREFIANHLAPLLQDARKRGINTQVLLHDHNWDDATETVNTLLNDPKARAVTGGVAFHCYTGTHTDAVKTMAPYPDVPRLNTECTSRLDGEKGPSGFHWWMYQESVDAIRDGFNGSIGWNLCLDEKGGPKNDHGCRGCRGMVTIHQKDKGRLEFNEEFYGLAQTSSVVKKGAVRIGSTDLPGSGLYNVAFQNSDGSIALVVRNDKAAPATVTIRNSDCEGLTYEIPAKGAVSFVWR